MKFNKWIRTTAIAALLFSSVAFTSAVNAEQTRTIVDESIYDLLVDRYFNATNANDDSNTDPKDPTKFAGGDFKGIGDRISEISNMGFSIISVGSIFDTEKYDGSLITSYSAFEPSFGTREEFIQLIDLVKDYNMSIMVDFPLTNVSKNHEWAKDSTKADWIVGTTGDVLRWDLKNKEVQEALIDAVVQFVSTYEVGGIRLTNLDIADTAFLNEMIAAIKAVDENIYVIANSESDANFDATFYNEVSDIFRNAFKNIDEDSSAITKYVDPFVTGKANIPTQLMIDHLNTDRFVYSVEIYPPTRIKMAIATTLLLPGVPVMQYGTEIAMNGEAGPEAHQLYNFKTDSELKDFIGDIQTLRNKSETLRRGDFNLIQNEDGLIVFQRSSDKENWIVIINNTSMREKIEIPQEIIGENKELRGMLNGEIFRAGEDGTFRIIQDREVVEIYQVIDERGINVSYIIAMALVYIVFIGFIVALMKRAKRQKAMNGDK